MPTTMSNKAQIVMDNIKTRRSIRQYKPTPVPDELIEWVIEAARWAPSAHNCQPIEYIVVRDSEGLDLIAQMSRRTWMRAYAGKSKKELKDAFITLGQHQWNDDAINAKYDELIRMQQLPDDIIETRASRKNKSTYDTAPVMVIILASKQSLMGMGRIADAWMAVQNILLAAHSAGLGAIPTIRACGDPELNKPEAKIIKEYFGIPSDKFDLIGIVCLGHPDEQPIMQKRDLDEIMYKEKFGNPWFD